MALMKVQKVNIYEKILIRHLGDLSGSIFAYGKIKAGKTSTLLSLAQSYHIQKGYKVVDLFGGHRNEQHYWGIPSQDVNYWAKFKKKLNVNPEQHGPLQFKVNYLYPVFLPHTPNKLPHNPPDVKTKLFTIPYQTITSDDIKLVINDMSQNAVYYWREALENVSSKTTINNFENLIIKLGGANSALFKNFIHPLARSGLIQPRSFRLNLDVKEEMKERDVITVLCLDFVPKEYHLFIMGWFLNQCKQLLDDNKIRRGNLYIIREASEYFKATTDSVVEPRYKLFRMLLANYIRYGRRGMHFLLDTQSPSETRGLVEGSQDITLLGRIASTSKRDRAEVVESLYSVGAITKELINSLHTLRPGEFIVIEEGKDAYKRYIPKPRSMYWREGYGNFRINIWKRFIGDKWYPNIESELKEIETAYSYGSILRDSKVDIKEKRLKAELSGDERNPTDKEFEEDNINEDFENSENIGISNPSIPIIPDSSIKKIVPISKKLDNSAKIKAEEEELMEVFNI